MSNFSISRVLPGAPERVFQILTDFPNAAKNIGGIERVEMLTEGPVGPGTRFRETRVFMKKEATEEMEVVGWDPPRSYTLGAFSCGCDFRTQVSFVPEGDGTRVTMDFESTPRTLAAKLSAPLGALMMGPMKKCIEQDLIDAGNALGGGAATADRGDAPDGGQAPARGWARS